MLRLTPLTPVVKNQPPCYLGLMIAKIYSAIPYGFEGRLVEVEGDINRGLPAFNIVGMANKTINEAKERVKSALVNSGFMFPNKKITINLAPADLRKEGPCFDLPIAIGELACRDENWIPMLKDAQLSGVGGIETWQDALDFIKMGCRNVQICTAVMQYGYRIIDDLIAGLEHYMAEKGVEKLEDLVGTLLPHFRLPSNLDRDSVVFPVIDREKCIGCGRCYTSCTDGGHQAISFGEDRKPHVDGSKCVGCLLCRLVCPVEAISPSKRVRKRKNK